jgi:hypothetical protein
MRLERGSKLKTASLVLYYSKLEMLVRDKHSSLLDPFRKLQKMKCCEYAPCGLYRKTFYGRNKFSNVQC